MDHARPPRNAWGDFTSLLAILRVLFPNNVVRWFAELLCRHAAAITEWLIDDDLLADPHQRAWIEGHINSLERAIHFLIHDRAHQMLGPRWRWRRLDDTWPSHRPLDAIALKQRFVRVLAFFNDAERLAERRAARIARDMAANPLGLDDHTPREEAPLSFLHRLCRGRWLVALSRRDGGGPSAERARGPPFPHAISSNDRPIAPEAPASEVAPI